MMIRLMTITVLGLLLGACANTGLNQTYEIKAEKEKTSMLELYTLKYVEIEHTYL